MTFKGGAIRATRGPNPLFIKHIQRRSIPLSQVAEATATHRHAALVINPGSHRGQVAIWTERITAGLERLGHGAQTWAGLKVNVGSDAINPTTSWTPRHVYGVERCTLCVGA